MQVTEMKWWNCHWLQRQAGTGLKGAYQKKKWLGVFQLISGLKK